MTNGSMGGATPRQWSFTPLKASPTTHHQTNVSHSTKRVHLNILHVIRLDVQNAEGPLWRVTSRSRLLERPWIHGVGKSGGDRGTTVELLDEAG
jgi:hypothetical protein